MQIAKLQFDEPRRALRGPRSGRPGTLRHGAEDRDSPSLHGAVVPVPVGDPRAPHHGPGVRGHHEGRDPAFVPGLTFSERPRGVKIWF